MGEKLDGLVYLDNFSEKFNFFSTGEEVLDQESKVGDKNKNLNILNDIEQMVKGDDLEADETSCPLGKKFGDEHGLSEDLFLEIR